MRRGSAPSACLVERPRTQLAAHQAQINTKIAKEKDNGIAALRVRLAGASADAESTASGDSNDGPSLLASAAAD
jgi:hypothetical protein